MKNIGQRIAFAREAKEMSQLELSRRAGLGRSSISEIESGKNLPSLKTITSIARG